MHSYETDVLMDFLSLRPEDSLPVLNRFSRLPGAVSRFDGGKNNYVYLPGQREDSVLLVAHADTVWDRFYAEEGYLFAFDGDPEGLAHRPVFSDGVVKQGGSELWGLGADDRAGCAMLWLLKDSGHSILVTDGEEHGQIGAHYLADHDPALLDELNAHRYMIQLDRRGGSDYKTYHIPVSGAFCEYIERNTGFSDAGKSARTDIVALCKKICGVNLSIGYEHEHRENEILHTEAWLNTLNTVKRLLEAPQPAFPLAQTGV